MLEADAARLSTLVKAALAWRPGDSTDDPTDLMDQVAERFSKQEADGRPVLVKRCCGQCIFLNPNDTCENFESPKGAPARTSGEWIPIPRGSRETMCCEAWIDEQLGRLLLRGLGPGDIAYGRRHPKIEVPRNAPANFAGYLASLPRAQTPVQPVPAGAAKDPAWPPMDERLKSILKIVEERRNEEMWGQYQGALFLMGPRYIGPILDRLVQKPDSQLAPFMGYLIETHGYHYSTLFGYAGGAEAFERVVTLLDNDSPVVRDLCGRILQGISRHAFGKKPPSTYTDAAAWRAWGQENFRFEWKRSG